MLDDHEHGLIQHAHLQVATDLNAMDQVLQWFEQFNHSPLEQGLWMQGRIALIEGFTNAVQHAHKSLPPLTPIDLRVHVFSHQLDIYIWDRGPAFDLEALLNQPQQDDPLNRESHWGGVLMKKLRDKHGWLIRYTCPASAIDDRNCLLMSCNAGVSKRS